MPGGELGDKDLCPLPGGSLGRAHSPRSQSSPGWVPGAHGASVASTRTGRGSSTPSAPTSQRVEGPSQMHHSPSTACLRAASKTRATSALRTGLFSSGPHAPFSAPSVSFPLGSL